MSDIYTQGWLRIGLHENKQGLHVEGLEKHIKRQSKTLKGIGELLDIEVFKEPVLGIDPQQGGGSRSLRAFDADTFQQNSAFEQSSKKRLTADPDEEIHHRLLNTAILCKEHTDAIPSPSGVPKVAILCTLDPAFATGGIRPRHPAPVMDHIALHYDAFLQPLGVALHGQPVQVSVQKEYVDERAQALLGHLKMHDPIATEMVTVLAREGSTLREIRDRDMFAIPASLAEGASRKDFGALVCIPIEVKPGRQITPVEETTLTGKIEVLLMKPATEKEANWLKVAGIEAPLRTVAEYTQSLRDRAFAWPAVEPRAKPAVEKER